MTRTPQRHPLIVETYQYLAASTGAKSADGSVRGECADHGTFWRTDGVMACPVCMQPTSGA